MILFEEKNIFECATYAKIILRDKSFPIEKKINHRDLVVKSSNINYGKED